MQRRAATAPAELEGAHVSPAEVASDNTLAAVLRMAHETTRKATRIVEELKPLPMFVPDDYDDELLEASREYLGQRESAYRAVCRDFERYRTRMFAQIRNFARARSLACTRPRRLLPLRRVPGRRRPGVRRSTRANPRAGPGRDDPGGDAGDHEHEVASQLARARA